MFTHPHESSPSSTMLFIIANDQSGLERAVVSSRFAPDWLWQIGWFRKAGGQTRAAGIEKAGYVDTVLSNSRSDQHLTFHNVQSLGMSWEYHVGCHGSINGGTIGAI